MHEPDVLLIAMPWQALHLPSIQLGILQGVLDRAGLSVEVRSLNLAFMEHCHRETAGSGDREIRVADYAAVADDHHPVGLGDWIFAVPPFRDDPDLDGQYLAYLRSVRIRETDIAKAHAMRALVPSFLGRCADEILALSPRVVGFTITFNQTVPSLALAGVLKHSDPSLAIVFGGANCEGPMGLALHRAFPWVDIVVRGEGERVLPELVKDLLVGEPVRPNPGLCYRDGERSVAVPQTGEGALPMDEIPAPVYDEYFDRLSKARFAPEIADKVRLVYEAARGCWWGAKSHCTFCGHNDTSMTFRSKSPDRVVHEITTLASRYRRLDFYMADNIMDFRYLREVLPHLRDAACDLSIFWETKANLNREQVSLLRDAGVTWTQPGIESLSTPILRLMRKGVTAFQNIRLLKLCAEYGLLVCWNVLYGLPGEPPEEYARMADLVPTLTHLPPPNLIPLVLERFSPYHERPQDWGIEVTGPLPRYRFTYPVDDATLSDLAHTFAFRYLDGRDPETYVAPLRRAIDVWQAHEEAGSRTLRFRRGPGFIIIRDRRPGLGAGDYMFDELKARIYLACEDGATAEGAWAALGSAGRGDTTVNEVRKFLDDMVTLRLAYEEGGHYLALALPAILPEQT